MTPDLLNFKKGWMSKLDSNGEWKKHWFVLTDAGLKYYRDSSAEEREELDGEVDLRSCLKVSEFDVEKNYGFQIQTSDSVFTLSAMTAGIRKNWIEVLKKSIQPISSPDLTQLPDNSSDKENSHGGFSLSSRWPSSCQGSAPSEPPGSTPPALRRLCYVELCPAPDSSGSYPVGQREAGEGQGREQSQWQEDRSTSSQWEAVLSRTGSGVGTNQRLHTEEQIEKKWVELERMPLKEMSSFPPIGCQWSSQSANEALQREVASLKQQLEQLQRGGGGPGGGLGGGVGGGPGGGPGGHPGGRPGGDCGPDAPCSRSLLMMERSHLQAVEELQRQHKEQMRSLETEKDRLLQADHRDTTRVVEALKKRHQEELDRLRRVDSQPTGEVEALLQQLVSLSERYSLKCVELNRLEQNTAEREREMRTRERETETLRRHNQDLKQRLMELMRSSPGSEDDQTSCELQVLLRMKEHETEFLHREMSCLRNELQTLHMEKQFASQRYMELQEELRGMKGRNEREMERIKEHLRLSLEALREGGRMDNSLDH